MTTEAAESTIEKKIPACRERVRDPETLEMVRCPGPFTKMNGCANKENHVLKYRTGFCCNGQCEGTHPRSKGKGLSMATCPAYLTCPCECHEIMNTVFKVAQRPRILVENSEYTPIRTKFYVPSLEEVIENRIEKHLKQFDVIEAPAPNVATIYERKNRNQNTLPIEKYTLECCNAWTLSQAQNKKDLTPDLVIAWIKKAKGEDPPSRGAVYSTFKRWEEMGFCVTLSNPFRFVSFTKRGLEMGLEALRLEYKLAKKSERK